MVRFNLLSLSWREIFPVRNIIPPLSHADHKGSMGRIGVIGGSADYTGAPFYAADSALKFGADLSFVFCSKEASTPIKCYSPELMVTSFYDDSKLMSEDTNIVEQEMSKSISRVREALPRIHGLVIGPGLGRHENVLRTVEGIIEEVKSKNLHVVVDADGLFLLNRNPSLFRDYSRCIITPNKMEFDRLSEAVRNQLRNHEVASPTIETILQELSVENEAVKTRALSLALGGVTVYRKGEVDLITSGNDVYAITERGSPRRCGGQGDILAGTLATAYYWAFKAGPQNLLNISTQLTNNTKIESFESRVDLDDIAQIFPEVQANERAILSKSLATAGGAQRLAPSTSSFPSSASRDRIGAILASLLAGNIVKQASSLAFNKFGRSMTAPNVIGDLGNAFNTFVDDKA